jgi:sodium-dependent phosphate transporter
MYLWIVIVGGFVSFYNSWGIGANDCANSFATSVGSKVLTLKQAVIIAAVFEFLGAFLMGSHVANTIRKKIVNLDVFEATPEDLMLGMLCANMSSGIWLHIASYLKLPVSTTHSIVGAIVGFSLAYSGSGAIVWSGILKIVLSWFLSPVISGIFALAFYSLLKRQVFLKENGFERTIYIFPLLTFFTFLISSFFIIYKGTPQLNLDDIPLWIGILSSTLIATTVGLLSWVLYIPYARRRMIAPAAIISPTAIIASSEDPKPSRSHSYTNAMVIEPKLIIKNLTIDENIVRLKNETKKLKDKRAANKIQLLHGNAVAIDDKIERLCSPLQVITACFSSFAHGANDVANSIAPYATIYAIYINEAITKKTDVPIWILFLGGSGIVLGLATWGYKVINRIGRELTKITASRGFIIELSAALTVLIASRLELPVSTTHCQIGSVVGCGFGDKKNNVEWKLVREIIYSWLITVPITGMISAALFSYGYYSPSETI